MDPMYLPIQVGAVLNPSIDEYIKDNTGENISEKNKGFCELTALYWAWKNLDADYIGLVHYRRYLSCKKEKGVDKFESVLTERELKKLVSTTDIVLPKKRKYYIETLYSHYKNTLHIEPLDQTGRIINEKFPEYYSEFELLKKRTSAHMFNMMIMKKKYLDEYCEWLFEILFELEKRMDKKQYDMFQGRFYGRVSELLLDVWLNTKGYTYKEVGVLDMEDVNWLYKGVQFLRAKIFKKKYNTSF